MSLLRRNRPDTRAATDEEVGAHYDDPVTANGLARLYDAPTPLGEFYRQRMRRIDALLDGAEGDLLDAGCGAGQMLRFLHESRADQFALTGVDRSAAIIDAARRIVGESPAIRLVVGRLEDLPFDTASFHVVLAMGSLEYVASIERALGEIARVTRPGGLAILTMQNKLSPYRLWDATVWSWVRRCRGSAPSPIVQRLAERRLRAAVTAVGLVPVSVVYYGFNVFVPPLDTRAPHLAMRAQHRLEPFASGPLHRLATDYMVVARRVA